MKFYFILMILALDIIEAALASIAICNPSFNTEQHLRTVNIITGALLWVPDRTNIIFERSTM